MSASIGYINGRFIRAGDISFPLNDAGLLWGAVVTDRLRTFGGRLFRLDEHLRRFRQSCELARVPQSRSDADLAAACERLVAENSAGHDVSVVWLATPGHGSEPTLIAYTQPIDTGRIVRLNRFGARLVTTPAALSSDPRIKHRSRLPVVDRGPTGRRRRSRGRAVVRGADARARPRNTDRKSGCGPGWRSHVAPGRDNSRRRSASAWSANSARRHAMPFAERPFTLPTCTGPPRCC